MLLTVGGEPDIEGGVTDPFARDERAVKRAVRLLPRRNPMRRAVEAVLVGEEPPAETVAYALGSLRRYSFLRCIEQRAAAWVLGRMEHTREAHAEVVQRLNEMVGDPHWRPTKRWLVRGIVASYLAICLFGSWEMRNLGGDGATALVCIPVLVSPIVYAFVTPGLFAMHGVRATAATSLGRLKARKALGTLAAAVTDRDVIPGYKQVRSGAIAALLDVLPTLTEADYALVSRATLEHLCRLLWRKDEQVVRAVLDALAKVGDGSCLAEVEKLAVKSESRGVREHAGRVAAVIRERARRENAPKVLLRPAVDGPEALLRPAGQAEEAAPEQLLRAALPGEDA